MSKDKKPGSTASFQDKLGGAKHVQDEEVSELEQETGQLSHPSYQELQDELTKAEELKTQYWERMLRMQAENENTQRRVERDIANAHKFALEKFALELLPVVDSLERAIAVHHQDESGAGSWLDGVTMTLRMLTTAMEKFGIEAVNPVDEPFNPELQQAVSMQESDKKPGTVITVLQKGYLLNKRLIRPAMVIVAK